MFSASVDPVIASIQSDCQSSRLQTQTYGSVIKIISPVETQNYFRWALLGGAGLDIAADWYGEQRQPSVRSF